MRISIPKTDNDVSVKSVSTGNTVYKIGDDLLGTNYHSINKTIVYITGNDGSDVDIYFQAEFEAIRDADIDQMTEDYNYILTNDK